MGVIFSGLDEFNRIDVEVLSEVAFLWAKNGRDGSPRCRVQVGYRLLHHHEPLRWLVV